MTIVRLCDQVLRYSGRADVGLRERLAMALLDLAARFGARDSRGMLLTLLVTHDMLAELVGASRQRITLHLNGLVRCGAVKRVGRRLILVTEELERIGRMGNLWRRLVLAARIATWSLISLQQRLVKTDGRRSLKHAQY